MWLDIPMEAERNVLASELASNIIDVVFCALVS